MLTNYTVSAFADEISESLDVQMKVLKQHGIQHIEVRGIAGRSIVEYSLAEIQQFKQILDENQFRVSSIGSPIGKIMITDAFEEHLTLFKHTLEIARIFQSPFIRMFSFYIPENVDANQFETEVIRRWQSFLKEAEAYEVTLLHENEKGIYGDTAERCYTLVSRLNSDKVKLAFDPANFVQCQEEVFPKAYELLKSEIAYLHIKDALAETGEVTPAGLGDGQVKEVLAALAREDFQGFASLEPHLTIFEGFANLEKNQVDLREQPDGIRTFTVAAEALKGLFKTIDQEWK
ncbi:sugar phosphate isomerase/epimerase family protein [Carnobacterium gallinarum]|uniref:sugar phosphate isomerase/epimerase family protein n=1 Tax=Carnobacterium gallinarum TaxID=2749 RepID=UPI000554D946|nr:sugar phosphate isomerase/epimerase family protein [Carnobacterium gallinarum]